MTVKKLCSVVVVHPNARGSRHTKPALFKLNRQSPGLGSAITQGTLDAHQRKHFRKPQESTQKCVWGSWNRRVRTLKAAGSLLYPPPEAQHIPAQALNEHRRTHTLTGTQPCRFRYTNMGIAQSVMASLAHVQPLCLSLIFNILVEVWIPIKAC